MVLPFIRSSLFQASDGRHKASWPTIATWLESKARRGRLFRRSFLTLPEAALLVLLATATGAGFVSSGHRSSRHLSSTAAPISTLRSYGHEPRKIGCRHSAGTFRRRTRMSMSGGFAVRSIGGGWTLRAFGFRAPLLKSEPAEFRQCSDYPWRPTSSSTPPPPHHRPLTAPLLGHGRCRAKPLKHLRQSTYAFLTSLSTSAVTASRRSSDSAHTTSRRRLSPGSGMLMTGPMQSGTTATWAATMDSGGELASLSLPTIWPRGGGIGEMAYTTRHGEGGPARHGSSRRCPGVCRDLRGVRVSPFFCRLAAGCEAGAGELLANGGTDRFQDLFGESRRRGRRSHDAMMTDSTAFFREDTRTRVAGSPGTRLAPLAPLC